MSDPFARLLDQTLGAHIKQEVSSPRREQAIAAYRQGIALPDVSIADRFSPYEPLVIGSDGQLMTTERRRKLMEGKPTMCDEHGKIRTDLDYRKMHWDVEEEPLGESAVKNRPGIRVAPVREALVVDYAAPETLPYNT